MDTMNNTPEQNELLENSKEVQLFLQFGQKIGLFAHLDASEKMYKCPGAVNAIIFLVHQLVESNGLEEATKILNDLSSKLSKHGEGKRKSQLDLFAIKQLLLAKRKELLEVDRKKAWATKQKPALTALQVDENMIAASELDMDGKHPVTLSSLDSVPEEQLPSWGLAILQGELFPAQIEAILKVSTSAELPMDGQVDNLIDASHRKALRTIKV